MSFANSSLTFEYNSVLFAKAYADSPDKEKSKREIKPKTELFATDESGVRKMKGYYTPEKSGEVSEKPTGCLRIEVSNLPEFAELIEQAKKEADQLQKTLNSLSYFDLNIDFEVKEKTK